MPWKPNLAKNERKSYTIGDNFNCEQDTDTGFGSEIGFLLSVNSTRILPCVRGQKNVTMATNFGTRTGFISKTVTTSDKVITCKERVFEVSQCDQNIFDSKIFVDVLPL